MTSLCLLCGRPQISCYPRTHFVQVSFSPFSVQTLWRHQPRVAVLGYAKMVSPGWQGEPTTENCVDLVGWTVWLVDLRHSDYQRRQDTRKFPRQGRPHQRWDSYDNGTGNDLKRELFIIPPPPQHGDLGESVVITKTPTYIIYGYLLVYLIFYCRILVLLTVFQDSEAMDPIID